MRGRTNLSCILSILLAICLAACNGDEGDPCEGVSGSCEIAGDTSCDAGNQLLLTCQENADGCPVWVEDEDCSANGEVCVIQSGEAFCAAGCEDNCTPQGSTRCDGTVIQTCSQAANGCLDWADGVDCADSGADCDDSGASAVCVCSDACQSEGATRCDGTVIQTCSAGANGCLDWADGDDCADTFEVCDDSGDTAVCVCSDACQNEGDARCEGTLIQTCALGGSGCLDWADDTDCADTGDVCDDSGGTPVCVCADACGPENSSQCNGDLIQTCLPGNDGCLEWTTTVDCSAAGDLCDDSGGTAECLCTDLCQVENATRCSGTVIQTCSTDADGCLDWIDGQDCLDSGMICTVTDDVASCEEAPCAESVADGSFELGTPNASWEEMSTNFDSPLCDSQCNEDFSARTGEWYAWFGGATSGGWPVFEEGSLSQEVVINPTSALLGFWFKIPHHSGDPADVFEVSVDGTVVFTVNDVDWETYPDWTFVVLDLVGYADGASHTLEFYGVMQGVDDVSNFFVDDVELLSGTDCCFSTCETAGDTQCDGWMLQTCATTGLGCLEWEDTDDCASFGQECVTIDAQNAECIDCTDECATLDEKRCQGDMLQTCIEGPDTCLDWDDTQDCHAAAAWCDDSGAEPVCVPYGSMTPGDDCADGNMVALDIPASLPALDPGRATCGAGNDYADTCMENYDGGEDVVYALNVSEDTIVAFVLDPLGTTWTGLGLDDACPLDGECALVETNAGGGAYQTDCTLIPAGMHYLMVDTYPSPDCIPAFDLFVFQCACATGDTLCSDANTLSTCDSFGEWIDTACLNGCTELSPGVFGCLPDPGDDCDDTIKIAELPFSVTDESIEFHTNAVSMATTSCTGYGTDGKDVIYELDLAEDTTLHLVVDASYDVALYVVDQCGADLPDAACLAGSDAIGGEEFDAVLTAGTYFIVVDYYFADGPATGTFSLTITAP